MGDLETCSEKLGCWAGFYFGFLKRKCRAGVLGSGFPACNYVDLWCSSSLVLELLLHLPGFSSPAPVPGQGWGSCRAKSTRGRDVGFQASHGQEPFPSEPCGPAVGLGAPRRRAPSRETPCAPTVLEGQWGNFVLYFFPTFMLVFVLSFHFHLQGERPEALARGWHVRARGGWFLRAGAGWVLEGRIDPRVSPGSGRCVCVPVCRSRPARSSRNTIPMGSFPLHLKCRLQRY